MVKPTGTATGAEGMNTKETNRKMNNTMVSNTKNREADAKVQIDAAGASGRAAAAEIAGKDASKITEASVNTYTNMVTTYTTMATETISAIFGSKCNAIERMRRDYMTIIRFHVKYWLGRPNNSDDNVTPTSSGSGAPGLGTVQPVAQPNANPAPATT